MANSQWPMSAGGGVIKTFTQSTVIQSSGSILIPRKTIRIEALMCGGGGGGGGVGGGGFGGLFVIEIPNPGILKYLDHIIGSGGLGGDSSTRAQRGGTTKVLHNGSLLAAVGGGGAGTSYSSNDPAIGPSSSGLYGGGGGARGYGGRPPLGKIIWTPFDAFEPLTSPQIFVPTVDFIHPHALPYGSGGFGGTNTPSVNHPMPGGGGSFSTNTLTAQSSGVLGGGGGLNQDTVGAARTGAPGGSLASISIWGLTGFAGGLGGVSTGVTTNAGGGGGGGGMLGAGQDGGPSQNLASYLLGQGGNGGGGGGSHISNLGTGGKGGDGFIVYRFYLTA